MRLFVAGFADAEAQRTVSELVHGIRGGLPQHRLVPPENLHVTLRFLGEVAAERLEELRRALDAGLRHAPAPCTLHARAFCALPARRPRVLALQLDSNGALERLAGDIDAALADGDWRPRDHAFRAHLSLARPVGRSGRLGTLPVLAQPLRLGFERFALYDSQTLATGARYALV